MLVAFDMFGMRTAWCQRMSLAARNGRPGTLAGGARC